MPTSRSATASASSSATPSRACRRRAGASRRPASGVSQSESQLRELEREQARREAELATERAALAGELRAAYVNGREEQLKLLLNQEDPASFGRTLAWYGYFGRARAGRIDGIRDKLEHLALVREKIAAETERLRELEIRQEQELDALSAAQKRRNRAVVAIDSQIKSRGGQISRLQNQARSLEKLIAELRKALENVPVAKQAPFEGLRGKLPWPVQSGKVLARFGQPRAGGSLRWQGMLVGHRSGCACSRAFCGARRVRRLVAGHGADDRARSRQGLHEPVRAQRRALPQGRRARGRG